MKMHASTQESAEQKGGAIVQAVPQAVQANDLSEVARSEGAALQQLHDMASGSPGTSQLKSLQAMMNASPHARSLQTVQVMAQRVAKPNNTGLPDQLKSGIESLSGMSMDHVKVHYNSDKPAQLQAHAYAQGSEIHVGPGQEQHLPHEAWHVVQQAQGRVKPTLQMKGGVPVNDNAGLEAEADLMGARALGVRQLIRTNDVGMAELPAGSPSPHVALQRKKNRPDDATLVTLIGDVVGPTVGESESTVDGKANAVWTHLDRIYEAHKTKGATLIQDLNNKVAEFKAVATKQNVIDAQTTKDNLNSGKFSTNYAHAIERLPSGRYRVNTKGYNPTTTAKPVVPNGKNTGAYSNEFDVGLGEITAAWNFAEQDDARGAGIGINNSEILWNQHKEAAKKHFESDPDKDDKVNAAMKSISKIIRSTVINLETIGTVYMAYPNGEMWTETDKEWVPGSDDFNAILGTENARAVPYFLMDHVHELEKTIDKIETKDYSDMNIGFKTI